MFLETGDHKYLLPSYSFLRCDSSRTGDVRSFPGSNPAFSFIKNSFVVGLQNFFARFSRKQGPQRPVVFVGFEISCFRPWCERICSKQEAIGITVEKIRGYFERLGTGGNVLRNFIPG